ncbi:MAG: hypothetical protein ACI8Z5_001979, partial [Lentimonas sp.]
MFDVQTNHFLSVTTFTPLFLHLPKGHL